MLTRTGAKLMISVWPNDKLGLRRFRFERAAIICGSHILEQKNALSVA